MIVVFVQLVEIMRRSIQVVPNMDIVINNGICEEDVEDNEVLTSDMVTIPELDFGRSFDEITLTHC